MSTIILQPFLQKPTHWKETFYRISVTAVSATVCSSIHVSNQCTRVKGLEADQWRVKTGTISPKQIKSGNTKTHAHRQEWMLITVLKKRCAAIFALEEYMNWIFYTVLWVCVHVFYRSEQAVIKYIRTKHVLHVHTQNPLSISPHSLVYQFITILRGPYHSLCLCCKLGIKHAPASGSTEGLAKGNLSHLTAGCLPAE